MKINRSRTVAAAGALTLGTLSLLGSSAAYGEVTDFGNIEDRTGSLTIHKFLHQAGEPTGDVSAAPADAAFTDPVPDVVFTVDPLLSDGVALDLREAAGWDALDGVTAPASCTAPEGFTLGVGMPMDATDATGTATITLDMSAYLVCETDAPAEIVDTAAPFVLTVPLPEQNGWVYDIHAYPKNGAAGIQKSIQPQEGLGLGSSVHSEPAVSRGVRS